jgi:AcrR family transcriptional regulator
VGLAVEDIVNAAVELLDKDGAAGVTIQRLSAVLGVTDPTIYWHVGSKAHLWELVVDHVLEEVDGADRISGGWDEQLRHFLGVTRVQLLAHPHVYTLMRTSRPRVYASWGRHVLEIMRAAGFDEEDAPRYALIVLWHLVGFTQLEGGLRYEVPSVERVDGAGAVYQLRAGLDVDPELASLTNVDVDLQHDLAVDVLITGIKAVVRRRRRSE